MKPCREMSGLFILAGALLFAVACTPSDKERCSSGQKYVDSGCVVLDTDTGTGTDTAPGDGGMDGGADGGPTEWFGSPCTCSGAACESSGVPLPAGGAIVGCAGVPKSWPGAELVCLRSYKGPLAPDYYFANGFCSLMASRCTGSQVICDMATFGDFEAMHSCPAGSVMLEFSAKMNIMGMLATVESKNCTPPCSGDKDCRTGETDPARGNEKAEYECTEASGVSFCYDPRNLEGDISATQF